MRPPRLLEPASKPIAEYREWDPRYAEVVRALTSVLSPLPSGFTIEHVGSTAIPGCGGKGVIDLLGLYQTGFLEEAKAFLLMTGFGRQSAEFSHPWPEARPMYLGYYRWKEERFLIYIHVVHHESDEVRRFRTFRDRLRQNPRLVVDYCIYKRKIVADGVTDTDAYAVQKRSFMHRVLGAEHALQLMPAGPS